MFAGHKYITNSAVTTEGAAQPFSQGLSLLSLSGGGGGGGQERETLGTRLGATQILVILDDVL